MPSYNGGGVGKVLKDIFLAPEHMITRIIIGIVVFIVILVLLVYFTTKKSKFHESILDKPMYDRSNHLEHTCPLSNPDNTVPAPPSSDKQSNDIVGLALHRSNGNLNKLNQAKSLSSVNKSTKLNFGLNAYNELTTYE